MDGEATQVSPEARTAAFTVTCPTCTIRADYLASAGRLNLWSHGTVVLEFACRHCHEFAYVAVPAVEAEKMTALGVPTTVRHAPAELLERPARTDRISDAEVVSLEHMHETTFEQIARRELGLGNG